MAATSHPLATEEALKILKKGGNAVDASITASIILSVVEPNATSIGGDCFAIVKMEGKEPVAYNGSGIAPEKANYEFFKSKNIEKIGITSEHSVTVGVLGKVKGQIEAPLIQIDGCVEGNLKATRLLEVLKNARIEGDIFTPSGGLKFMIGGAFKGNLFVIPVIQN